MRQRELDAAWSGLAAQLAQVEALELAAFNAEVERLGGVGVLPHGEAEVEAHGEVDGHPDGSWSGAPA
jgi:hypothetical protein